MTRENERAHTRIRIFFLCAVAAAGGMFTYKLFAFLSTIRHEDLAGFAFDPIIIYGFVAAGFLCMLAWAYVSGHFRDVESPKHDLFVRYREQVLQEAHLEAQQDDR